MPTTIPATTVVPAHLLAAYAALADEEKAIFLRRYVCFEAMEQTCETLNLTHERYKQIIEICLRQMRSGSPASSDQFVPETV